MTNGEKVEETSMSISTKMSGKIRMKEIRLKKQKNKQSKETN